MKPLNPIGKASNPCFNNQDAVAVADHEVKRVTGLVNIPGAGIGMLKMTGIQYLGSPVPPVITNNNQGS